MLYLLPIRNLDRKLHLDLVSHKNVVQPLYIEEFIKVLRSEVALIAQEKGDFLPVM